MATLAQYQTHLEKFGPECLLDTAAGELSERDLGQLKALVDSRERVDRWIPRHGWQPRKEREPRKCEECGLDLPPGANVQRKRHDHCSARVQRRRRAQRATASHPDASDG